MGLFSLECDRFYGLPGFWFMRSFFVMGTNLGIKTSMWRVRNTMDSCQIGVVVTCSHLQFFCSTVLAFGIWAGIFCNSLWQFIASDPPRLVVFTVFFGTRGGCGRSHDFVWDSHPSPRRNKPHSRILLRKP